MIAEQRLCRHRAQRDNYLRLDSRDLPHQKRRAGLALIALRRAVSRRTALDDVRNVNILTPQAHGLDHVIEQLPGAAHEGLALLVFVCARSFTNEHQLSFRVADPEDDLFASLFVQTAARAVAKILANQTQRLAGSVTPDSSFGFASLNKSSSGRTGIATVALDLGVISSRCCGWIGFSGITAS